MEKQFDFDSKYLKQLEMLRLEARKKFLGTRQGGHHSLKKGHGIEFADYRQYELGDNPRYIDWKLYARSDKLYVKRFQEEQEITISVLLDSSASMGIETDPGKWHLACKLALSFCYLGLIQQDRVNLTLLGSKQRRTAGNVQEFMALKTFLSGFTPEINPANSLAPAMQKAALVSRFPGVAIVISDFFETIEQIDLALSYIRSRNLQIVAIQTLGNRDFNPISANQYADLIDAESQERFELELSQHESEQLKSDIEAHSRNCHNYFKQRQIGFITIREGEDILKTLIHNKQSLGILK